MSNSQFSRTINAKLKSEPKFRHVKHPGNKNEECANEILNKFLVLPHNITSPEGYYYSIKNIFINLKRNIFGYCKSSQRKKKYISENI